MLDPHTNALAMIALALIEEHCQHRDFSGDALAVMSPPAVVLTVVAFMAHHRTRLRGLLTSPYISALQQRQGSLAVALLSYLAFFAEGGAFDPATMIIDANSREGFLTRSTEAPEPMPHRSEYIPTRRHGVAAVLRACSTSSSLCSGDGLWRVHCSAADPDCNYAERCVQVHQFRVILRRALWQLSGAFGLVEPRLPLLSQPLATQNKEKKDDETNTDTATAAETLDEEAIRKTLRTLYRQASSLADRRGFHIVDLLAPSHHKRLLPPDVLAMLERTVLDNQSHNVSASKKK